jgi:hypothetical protein
MHHVTSQATYVIGVYLTLADSTASYRDPPLDDCVAGSLTARRTPFIDLIELHLYLCRAHLKWLQMYTPEAASPPY